MEKKQVAVVVAGAVVLLALIVGSWAVMSGKKQSSGIKPTGIPVSVNEAKTNGSETAVQQPVVAVPDAPVADVTSKAEATKELTDLDSAVASVGTDTGE
ncbi:MAG: hypothetical protein HGA31_04935 [Candidatus Moranbacteria bacterium]|nr:hypothetical protein [Candidatus Moranbacteria bacterium]